MQRTNDNELILSATDLSNFLGCGHLSLLDRAATLGQIALPPKFEDPGLDVLRQRGLEHEAGYVERLKAEGRDVVEIEDTNPSDRERWQRLADATEAAMRAGADVIYQGCLFDGTWLGRPDFLERVERASALGDWSYEVVDTKLAREAKGGALLQVLLYADLLARVQGVVPESVRLELGGPDAGSQSFRVAHYAAYFRSVRRLLLGWLDSAPAELPVLPEPVQHCEVCRWITRCAAAWREADHLSLVAGITRRHRHALVARDVDTVASLARLPLPVEPRLGGVNASSIERVREQARVQVEGREQRRPVHELLDVEPDQGLAALPEPSPGDLFFDIEGDPYALTHGLEYLFGFVDASGEYTGWWSLSREEEKRTFERFVDFVIARLDQYPDMHIYHYNHYEVTALKQLMGRHASREDEVDRLLRSRVFVDLLRVVRRGLRASVESYSIKRLEPFYGYTREVDLRTANSALGHFEAWLQLGLSGDDGSSLLESIEGYNRDDCISTLRLRDWLETQRVELERRTGQPVPRPAPANGETPESVAEEQGEVAQLYARLLEDVPVEEQERTHEQHARWLLAHLLDFHRREHKSTWWEYFRCIDLSDEERVEDRSTLGGLEYIGVVRTVKRSLVHQYRYPAQDHGIGLGNGARDPETDSSSGEVVGIDDVANTIDLRRVASSTKPHPRALAPLDYVDDKVMRANLRRIARAVLEHGMGVANPYRAAIDLILRNPPRAGQAEGAALLGQGKDPVEVACGLIKRLDRTVLPIQGPPGAGKTHTAAHMIVEALRAGKKVGITATSHKVIGNLLDKVCEMAVEEGVEVRGIQRCDEDQLCDTDEIVRAEDNAAVHDALRERNANLGAGTAWLWSREDMANSVDVLFVDEAGQFSLANALAVAPAASSLVLVGDPRQLQQPQKGVHPPGVEVSALDHLLGGEATIGPECGLFLPRTWRLHPDLSAFTSHAFYDGRLESIAGLERQRIIGTRFEGSGLRLVTVEHEGNQSDSPEEVEVVASVFDRLVDDGRWTDVEGRERALGADDILIVAPYNAQVAAIRERLPGARVGTVDKFQGQEAPVVIYSMTTSSPEDAPRGMGFLYSPNRLNVATSRARCLAIVVASPRLFAPACRNPEEMRLANPFCILEEGVGNGEWGLGLGLGLTNQRSDGSTDQRINGSTDQRINGSTD